MRAWAGQIILLPRESICWHHSSGVLLCGQVRLFPTAYNQERS